MNRDHLLGCTQFVPDVENSLRDTPDRFDPSFRWAGAGRRLRYEEEDRKRWGPVRAKVLAKRKEVATFETGDHTPKEMRADFPHEYDFPTMLNDAIDARESASAVGITVNLAAWHSSWDKAMSDWYNEKMNARARAQLQTTRLKGNGLEFTEAEKADDWRNAMEERINKLTSTRG